jgi:DHA1 family bicyclomycin/chloramphenicol resistance-like MFS transporter
MSKKQHKILILLIGSIVAIGPFTIDMYLPGFLNIAQDFGVAEYKISYTLTSYFIGISVGQLFFHRAAYDDGF